MDNNLRVLEGDLEMDDGKLTGIKLIKVQLTLSGEEYKELLAQKARIAALDTPRGGVMQVGDKIMVQAFVTVGYGYAGDDWHKLHLAGVQADPYHEHSRNMVRTPVDEPTEMVYLGRTQRTLGKYVPARTRGAPWSEEWDEAYLDAAHYVKVYVVTHPGERYRKPQLALPEDVALVAQEN